MKTRISINQQSLFGGAAVVENQKPAEVKQTPLDTRYAAMNKAEERASEEWKEAYTEFILEYAETKKMFTAEMVRLAYCADPNAPRTHAEQASGGIFQRLIKEGRLVKCGYINSELRGNPLTAYTKGDK